MATADSNPPDPMEGDLEAAFCPKRFVRYEEGTSFLSTLTSLQRRIGDLVVVDPTRASMLFETLLAGCHAKADEVDGSSGQFGEFVAGLFGAWVAARQASGAATGETIRRLLACLDDDPHGFASRIERTIVDAFDRCGLAEFRRALEARLASATEPKPATAEGAAIRSAESERRRCGEILRAIHVRSGDVEAYAELCRATALSADDCRQIATMLHARNDSVDALDWIERGSALLRAGSHGWSGEYALSKLKREVLVGLGRNEEAIAQAWTDFRAGPSTYTYETLLALVPASERTAVHAEAIDAAERASLAVLIPLWIATREVDRLLARVSAMTDDALEAESHGTLEPAAAAIEPDHPAIAARVHRALGMRILASRKSKYYDEALLHFDAAKRCYARANLEAAWRDVVMSVRRDHYRKSVISGFERVVAGVRPPEKRSFLDEARDHWRRRTGLEHRS